ncbi:MAG TPA: hypothetical protein VMW95_03445, partial [Desulfobacterales bacterium]|nr:hypothetical protein [Desulfobacterales bacterium]
MSIGSVDMSKFQNTEEAAEQLDRASGQDQVQARLLTVSGSYVMEVSTFCFRNNKKADKPIIISPAVAPSSKGGFNLVASMKVVDGTAQVPAGDYITINVPVWPGAKATKEERENLFRLSKPRMCALLGVDNFKVDPKDLPAFIVDKFSTQWDEGKDGKFSLTKDHALKAKVVCVFEDSIYNNRETLNLVQLRRFKEGDKSISNVASHTQAPQEGFGSAAQ